MEKLKNLAWHWQLLIMFGIAALLFYIFFNFVTSPVIAEKEQLREQVASLRQKNEQAKISTQRINEFRALFASKSGEYEELKVLLPEQREITNILDGLQANARESRLVVNRFTPREDTPQGGITAKPVEIEIETNFSNLREFYDKMAKFQRIVSITDFKLNRVKEQSANHTLDAQFILTAYYVSPEPPPDAKAKTPAKPGAPAASPAAAAPAAK